MAKPTLRFNKNGKFRVLMVSDMHLGVNPKLKEDYNYKVIRGLDALIENTNPDFVMIGGDQCLNFDTAEKVKAKFEEIIEPITSRKIPWGAVFGNHDRECGINLHEEMKIYESMPYCLAEAGPEEISGVGNYQIPVLASDSDKIKYNLWAMDSQHQVKDFIGKFGLNEDTRFVMPNHLVDGSGDGCPLFDQVMWYYNKSVGIEKENGKKVPGVMFMHISLPEYITIMRNPEECGAIGSKRESGCATEMNSGLFLASLQRGDIKGYFFGHDHLIDMQGEYCGITMACDAAIGYNMSAHDDLRGGRVIDLYEDGGLETYMVKLIDILGRSAMRDEDYFEGGCRYHIRTL
ncbi:MAG: metallophosphoesterase [Clostridia bacterium]|nr:metallophosphoesterase [Clostridia bacterium]